jgi:hypothetical protein
MRLYLSAPMSGLKDFNRPAMLAAEAQLKRAGFSVVNPARLPAGKTWEWYMCRAIKAVMRCDAVAQMDGWRDSEGCLIELQVAYKRNMMVNDVDAYITDAGWFQSQ